MRKLLIALALTLVGAQVTFADGMTEVVSSTTLARTTRTVFNDNGSALTSGTVVAWDNDDTEYDRSGYPYVISAATADSIHVAGVTTNPSCPDQSLCEIVVEGPAITRIAHGADAVAEDTLVGASATTGAAGDYATGADTCALGKLLELREAYTGATVGTVLDNAANNNIPMWVHVQISCD